MASAGGAALTRCTRVGTSREVVELSANGVDSCSGASGLGDRGGPAGNECGSGTEAGSETDRFAREPGRLPPSKRPARAGDSRTILKIILFALAMTALCAQESRL